MANSHQTWLENFRAFESSLNGQASHPIHGVRKQAIAHFEKLSLPTSADEAWKNINTSALTNTEFKLAPKLPEGAVTSETLAPYTLDETIQLVFINGYFSEELSNLADLPNGVQISSLSDALAQNPDLLTDQLNHLVGPEERAFSALNTAFLQDGAYIYVAKNTVCEKPIHLLFYTRAESDPQVAYARNVVSVEDNAQISLIETYAGSETGTYLTNTVTEFFAGNNANIDHYKLELETLEGIHVANQHATLGNAANVTSHAFSIGGAFVRNDVSAKLSGEGCEATINGLYLLEGNQLIDNYTLLEHAEPHCPSHELYKGILSDKSRAVFRGKILVHQKAQKTDAYQQNENILLSDDARVNTKPQLEIYADDVKCSHGATVGQLNEEALFYLRARGISKTQAQHILLKAFADDIVDRVKIASLQAHLNKIILHKFNRLYATKELA